MPAPWRRGGQDRVEYVVVERDGLDGEGQAADFDIETPTPSMGHILRRSYTRRQMPSPTGVDYDSDDDDEPTKTSTRPLAIPSATSGPPRVRIWQQVQYITRD